MIQEHLKQSTVGYDHKGSQTHLSELGPASLFVPAEDPWIAQTRSVVAAAHNFTRLATLIRRIKLEIRPPLHRWTPQLQIIYSTATPSATIYSGVILRPDSRIECVVLGTEKSREDSVDDKTRDQTDEKERGGGKTARISVV